MYEVSKLNDCKKTSVLIVKQTFFTIVQLLGLVYAREVVLQKICLSMDESPMFWLLGAKKAKG